jgi:purine-binding chemotaxis protein CheW
MADSTEQILNLAAERRREGQVVDVDQVRMLVVVFELEGGGGFYGLPAHAVESIVAVHDITYVPGTPPWILGVVNVRGEIESVLDLKAVLGLAPSELSPDSRLLIAQDGELRSGLLVDRMADIVEIATASISPPPPPLEGGKGIYIQGEAAYGGRSLLMLDLGQVFYRALEEERV